MDSGVPDQNGPHATTSSLPAHLVAAPSPSTRPGRGTGADPGSAAPTLTISRPVLYLPAGWEFELEALARALSAATPGAWISHVTAARLRCQLWLPSWFSAPGAAPEQARALPPVRRKGVVGHTVLAFDDEVDGQGRHPDQQRPPGRGWTLPAILRLSEDLVCRGRPAGAAAPPWAGGPHRAVGDPSPAALRC